VLSGLAVGDRVASGDVVHRLRDGIRVVAVDEAAPGSPAVGAGPAP
jgi:hypothetical protein